MGGEIDDRTGTGERKVKDRQKASLSPRLAWPAGEVKQTHERRKEE